MPLNYSVSSSQQSGENVPPWPLWSHLYHLFHHSLKWSCSGIPSVAGTQLELMGSRDRNGSPGLYQSTLRRSWAGMEVLDCSVTHGGGAGVGMEVLGCSSSQPHSLPGRAGINNRWDGPRCLSTPVIHLLQ